MTAYLIRRLCYVLPILMGVNLITFVLFFVVNSPDDMARVHLGERRVTQAAIDKWKEEHDYARPLFWNASVDGIARVTDTIFYRRSSELFLFKFGQSDDGRDIGYDIRQRMGPSLAIALPVLIVELLVTVTLGLLVAVLRGTYFDRWIAFVCVALMSVSGLFYIIGAQYLIAKLLRIVPISGFTPGLAAVKFVALPIAVQVLAALGANVRWYRTVFLEEIEKEYVRTAWAKGLSESAVMTRHVLRNALLPLITAIVVTLPSLFLGSLITESFFAIPGLGSYTIDALQNQDFAIVRSMVFLGAVLYIVGLLLTDIAYAWADPRLRFGET